MEWSTTRSTGTSGSTTLGFLPSLAATLRIAARSASDGMPVRSCSRMRESTKGISSVRGALGFQFARWRTWSSVIFLPSQFRSTDSSTMRSDTGRRDVLTPRAFPRAGREKNCPLLPDPIFNSCRVLKRLCDILARPSDYEQFDEFLHRSRFQALLIAAQLE